jgi:hypothetical protein
VQLTCPTHGHATRLLPLSPPNMAPKRPSSQENSGRHKKKRRVTAARSISVQEVGGSRGLSGSNDSNGLLAQHTQTLE